MCVQKYQEKAGWESWLSAAFHSLVLGSAPGQKFVIPISSVLLSVCASQIVPTITCLWHGNGVALSASYGPVYTVWRITHNTL